MCSWWSGSWKSKVGGRQIRHLVGSQLRAQGQCGLALEEEVPSQRPHPMTSQRLHPSHPHLRGKVSTRGFVGTEHSVGGAPLRPSLSGVLTGELRGHGAAGTCCPFAPGPALLRLQTSVTGSQGTTSSCCPLAGRDSGKVDTVRPAHGRGRASTGPAGSYVQHPRSKAVTHDGHLVSEEMWAKDGSETRAIS